MRKRLVFFCLSLTLGCIDGFHHIRNHRPLPKTNFDVDHQRGSKPRAPSQSARILLSEQSDPSIHRNEPISVPFPDTDSLNEKLAELSQSHTKSAAIEINDILELCEDWCE